MKRIRSCTINGQRCRIVWRNLAREEAIGLAYPDAMLIELDPNWDEVTTLDTMVHEYIHKACPDLCEEKVDQMGEEIAKMLDRADLIKTEDE